LVASAEVTTDLKSLPCLTVRVSIAEAFRIPEKDLNPVLDKEAALDCKFLLPKGPTLAGARALALPWSWPTGEAPTDGTVKDWAKVDAMLMILSYLFISLFRVSFKPTKMYTTTAQRL
jgi:hypothetical protein